MAEERIPTKQKLAAALTAANAPLDMISRAEAGYYDDYLSPLAFPIHQLVDDANAAGLSSIAIRAMNGAFDAQDWEADAWAKSSEGRETFNQFLKGQ